MFPLARPRRLRRTAALRSLVRETALDPEDFVYPLFVRQGSGVKTEIAAMPGNYHFSVDRLVEEVGQAWEDGVRSVILFGIPERKDDQGSEAYDDGAAVQSAVRSLKSELRELAINGSKISPRYPLTGFGKQMKTSAIFGRLKIFTENFIANRVI